jgi:hypothetical protein
VHCDVPFRLPQRSARDPDWLAYLKAQGLTIEHEPLVERGLLPSMTGFLPPLLLRALAASVAIALDTYSHVLPGMGAQAAAAEEDALL